MDDQEKIHILLVDDNQNNLFALSAILERPDYELVTATSGKEALSKLLQQDFALVLLDVMMPQMDGFEVATAMKSREKTRYVPILFVTAIAKDLKQIYQGYSVGAVDYIQKPLEPSIVRAKVSVFVDLFRKNRQIEKQAKFIINSERAQFLVHEQIARTRAEKAEHRFRNLVNALDHAIIWESDITLSNFTFVSDRAEKLLGHFQEQWLTESQFFLNHTHRDDRVFIEKALHRLIHDPTHDQLGEQCEHRLISKDGVERWFHTGIQFELDTHGKPIGLRGLSVDIHSLKGVEHALRDSEERLDLALNAAQMGMWDWNLITGSLVWSSTLQRIWGYQPGEFTGKISDFWQRIHPKDLSRVKQSIQKAFDEGSDYNEEFRIILPDQSMHWINARGKAFRNSIQNVVRMSGTAIEITDRKKVEDELKHSEERYRTVVEGLQDCATVRLDLNGRVLEWNSGAEKITLFKREEAIGNKIHSLIRADENSKEILENEIKQATDHGTASFENWYIRKDGTRYFARGIINPLRSDHQIVGIVKMFRDETARERAIEEREQLLKDLHHAVKIREEVVAVVAHDLKNPLTAMSLNSNMLLKNIEKKGDLALKQQCTRIKRAVDRVISLTQDILDFTKLESGRFSINPHAEDIHNFFAEITDMFKPLADEKSIEFKTEVTSFSQVVQFDTEKMIQVFSNLIGNAIKFTGENGKILIRAQQQGQNVLFSVSDTGQGINEKEIPHIFERFWQSGKIDRKGLGLGLYIVRVIVEAHHGKIWVESKLGQGTTFYFTLPLKISSVEEESKVA